MIGSNLGRRASVIDLVRAQNIERLNSLRALTPLLCQSHRDKCFWNFMSSLYVICFVTIWCKDNKLIFYLSKYPNPLKSFMSSVSRHTLSKLFQLRTGYDVLGKYFQMRGIKERNHNCETCWEKFTRSLVPRFPLAQGRTLGRWSSS